MLEIVFPFLGGVHEIYDPDLPLLSDLGSLAVNGDERVLVDGLDDRADVLKLPH